MGIKQQKNNMGLKQQCQKKEYGCKTTMRERKNMGVKIYYFGFCSYADLFNNPIACKTEKKKNS